MSIATRTARTDWQGPLAAAAHSSCFAKALRLRERKTPPHRLQVSSSLLLVKGQVNGLDAAGFQEAVDEAAQLCPISRLFAGARISVEALLQPS